MIGPPPIFTLFPYATHSKYELAPTTPASASCTRRGTQPVHDGLACSGAEKQKGRQPERSGTRSFLCARLPAFVKGSRRVDRKSTRLNSSHANISYAVFCLKK